jgi:hypothetical protein
MGLLPRTRERISRLLQGKADTVPIGAQINEHVVQLCGGDMREVYIYRASITIFTTSRPKHWGRA